MALFTAALDNRVAAVARVSGVAPRRLATPDNGPEGRRHYSHLHGPVPRPVLVWAPRLDRYNPVADVCRAVEQASKACQKLGGRPPSSWRRRWTSTASP